MKAQFDTLTIGIEGDTIRFEGYANVDLKNAYKLQRFLLEQIQEIEENKRKELPWTKRLFR
jgi:hypothetical protein